VFFFFHLRNLNALLSVGTFLLYSGQNKEHKATDHQRDACETKEGL